MFITKPPPEGNRTASEFHAAVGKAQKSVILSSSEKEESRTVLYFHATVGKV